MAPTVTLTGTFEDILGNPVTTGTVSATLMGYGANIPRVAGVAIFDAVTATASVSGSGTFTLGPLYGNDVITPGPLTTYYQITMPAPGGLTVTKNYQLSGSGSFDLSQLVPMGTPLRGDNTIANAAIPQVFSPGSHQFLTGLNSLGQFSSAQPKGSDLSDVALGSTTPVTWNGDTGISRVGVGQVGVGNGTAGDTSGNLFTTAVSTSGTTALALNTNGTARFSLSGSNPILAGSSSAVLAFTATTPSAAADTGISRDSAGVIDVGNGTQGDKSGTLQCAAIKSASLIGASNGNTVTLLNMQGPAAAIVGTGSAVNVFSYTIPANTVGAGKGIRVKGYWQHSTGLGSVGYVLTLGSTNLANDNTATNTLDHYEAVIFNNTGVTNAQTAVIDKTINASTGNGVFSTSAIDMTQAQIVKLTFNAANTEQVTPKFWTVELIQ